MQQTDAHSAEGAISSHRVKLLIALVVLIGAIGYFAFQAFEGALVYYYTVDEVTALGATADSKFVRVKGKLVPDSFHRLEGSTVAEFHLTDGATSLSAAHDGVLPPTFFNEHSEIILEGRLDSDGRFLSENIVVVCPSKYVAQEDETG